MDAANTTAKALVRMTERGVVILGGGEHASVVIDAARAAGWIVVGIVDENPCATTCNRLGVAHLGGDDAGLELVATMRDASFVVAIGGSPTSPVRAIVAARYESAAARWATIVHPRAWVSPSASLGEGAVVLASAVVNTGAAIGPHAIVNTGAILEHDVVLGAFVHVAPGAVIGGGAQVGERSHVGLGSRVRDHVRIGRGVTVGMGATVVADVRDGLVVVGVPARERTP